MSARRGPYKPKKGLEPIYRDVGQAIARCRMELGWTQEAFALKLGLKRTSVTNIEAGRQRLQLHMFELIAKTLHQSIAQLWPTVNAERAEGPWYQTADSWNHLG